MARTQKHYDANGNIILRKDFHCGAFYRKHKLTEEFVKEYFDKIDWHYFKNGWASLNKDFLITTQLVEWALRNDKKSSSFFRVISNPVLTMDQVYILEERQINYNCASLGLVTMIEMLNKISKENYEFKKVMLHGAGLVNTLAFQIRNTLRSNIELKEQFMPSFLEKVNA